MNNEAMPRMPKIADFPYLQASLLERFSAVYLPDMGTAELKCCQHYYQRHQRTPKTADELAFLNGLVAQHFRDPSAVLISETKTEDRFLAETFADLMNKRAAVNPDYKMPCSFAEIPQIAQKYLDSCKKSPSVVDTLIFDCIDHHMLSLTAKKAIPSLLYGDKENGISGGERISHALVKHASLSAGDKLYAFLKSTDPTENFEEKLLTLASRSEVITSAKRLCPISRRGLLCELAELGRGFDVALSRLYGEDASATRLLDGDVGLLLVIEDTKASGMLMEALDLGLRPRLVGELRGDNQILLKRNESDEYRFSLHLLETLSFSRAYHTNMQPAKTNKDALSVSECRTKTVGKNNVFLAHVKGDSSRHAALYASLYAVSALVARGASLRDVRLAHRFGLPLTSLSPETLGEGLALLLGLYRASMELELHTVNSNVTETDENAFFDLYALSQRPENAYPDRLTHTGSRVYLLQPLYDEAGNPDFEDYKNMLEYVGKLQKNGHVLSARAVVGDVIPALERMSDNLLVEYLPDEPLEAKAGSILIETRADIQGTHLATTCEVQTEPPVDEQKSDDETGKEANNA
ncbi:MAG: hypothetical protein J6B12_05320 [Clostridia bacterium]|nr:hypothetical protein [Clostridia bacterium]